MALLTEYEKAAVFDMHFDSLVNTFDMHFDSLVNTFDFEFDSTVQEVPVKDYNELINKPSINSVILQYDKSFSDLGLNAATNTEINELFK